MRRPRVLLAVALAVTVSACTLEEATPTAVETTTSAPTALGEDPPDPRVEALAEALTQLRESVRAAREALVAAGEGGGDAAGAAETAVALLVADEPLAEGAAPRSPAPLFPGGSTSREETIDYGDAFTTTLTQARAAGPAGADVVALLRDPLAGDVGTWQRDGEGMLDLIRTAARRTSDLDEAEARVAELPGEGAKALAWALLADSARDDELRAAFAERGVAHLDLVLAAIAELDDAPETTEGG